MIKYRVVCIYQDGSRECKFFWKLRMAKEFIKKLGPGTRYIFCELINGVYCLIEEEIKA